MLAYDHLPDLLRDPEAGFVHRIRIRVGDRKFEGAAAWFDSADTYKKYIRTCLFEVPRRVGATMTCFGQPISRALREWVNPMLEARGEVRLPEVTTSDYAFERTCEDNGTLIFPSAHVYTLRKSGRLCAEFSAHDKLKLMANPAILRIR